ncbi:acetyltransferase (GNAT) family protein [Kribbella voronezhensis]|uniref:Acetyltransferase (GNAT) family protein n=1 Tax=Kribbella voronezhensis TaxID=2512212 RepID=A0A4R7T606_9ACTN|nr:GNAT family N-acetyltransferase [Kribbella voronezhensis]TDU87009.1 acetyltransferase (GNAT) family protein [Kribbella voronezhensis]
MAELEIGVASATELAEFGEWAAAEGWNPGRSDLLAFAATDPAGFLVGRLDGRAIASISAIRYGSEYGFIGFYIVRSEFRGQGFGIRLWRAGMDRLAGRNVALDGVVDQQENYRKSGFRHAYNHVRYEGVPAVDSVADCTLVDGRSIPFDQLALYDRRFFPADRSAFLASWVNLPGHHSLAAVRDGQLEGFAVLREARSGSRIGPLFATSDDVAHALVAGLSTPGTSIAIDVPDANVAAVKLAERLSLEPTFECARMYTGRLPDIELPGIFANTSLELG